MWTRSPYLLKCWTSFLLFAPTRACLPFMKKYPIRQSKNKSRFPPHHVMESKTEWYSSKLVTFQVIFLLNNLLSIHRLMLSFLSPPSLSLDIAWALKMQLILIKRELNEAIKINSEIKCNTIFLFSSLCWWLAETSVNSSFSSLLLVMAAETLWMGN